MRPGYRRRDNDENKGPYKQTELPIHQPCAVYYRQSTEAQIGNISTTLQTVDMVEHLMALGWGMFYRNGQGVDDTLFS